MVNITFSSSEPVLKEQREWNVILAGIYKLFCFYCSRGIFVYTSFPYNHLHKRMHRSNSKPGQFGSAIWLKMQLKSPTMDLVINSQFVWTLFGCTICCCCCLFCFILFCKVFHKATHNIMCSHKILFFDPISIVKSCIYNVV